MTNDSQRPSIIIGILPDTKISDKVKPLLNGIEEEQIPVAINEIDVNDVVKRAYQSALASRLSVGIAYEDNHFIVHYKNLKEGEPLFDYHVDDAKKLRVLGANAARLVKGIPFKKM